MIITLPRRGFLGVCGLGAALAAVSTTTACSGSSSSGGGSTSLTYWASNQGSSVDADKEALTPILDAFKTKTGAVDRKSVV